MIFVNSDDFSQGPIIQSFKSPNSRYSQELPTGYNHNDIIGESNLAKMLQSDDQGRSAYIQELQRTIDVLRTPQEIYRNRLASSRRSHFSGEGDERHQFAHNGEDRTHLGRIKNSEETEKGWKLEIKRWKRLNNRNGFSELYDETEKIEDIRKRERDIRSGGYVLSVYDEYDIDGELKHVLLAIHSPLAGPAPPSHHPSRDCGFPQGEEKLVDHNGQPLEDTLLRCFSRVGVFSMRDKEWALVKVDDLKPVRFRDKAFKRLVIRDDYKIIKAMVAAYRLETPGFSDIVSGKGRGLTILLHGPPGTGKTLTAGKFDDQPLAPQVADNPADQPQNAWPRSKSAHFLQSVAETSVLSQDNWRSS